MSHRNTKLLRNADVRNSNRCIHFINFSRGVILILKVYPKNVDFQIDIANGYIINTR